LDERARAYLEINCAHCHNPKGPAYTSGLDLASVQHDPLRYGVFKTPVAAGRGSAGDLYAVVPGKPDESFLLHRMESTDPGKMMPAVGRLMIHDEGIALIREWIREMQSS
jgi:mono/diheme cytochrome c family protein